MYQGGYEYQGQTGYLVGHGNDPPPHRTGEKGVGFDNTIIYRESYKCICSCSSISHCATTASGPGPPHYRQFAITVKTHRTR